MVMAPSNVNKVGELRRINVIVRTDIPGLSQFIILL